MTPTLFLVWSDKRPQVEALRDSLTPHRGLVRALAFLATDPAPDDAFAVDGPRPALTLELGFAALDALESAAGAWEQAFTSTPTFAAQAMLGRRFATPDPVFR